MDILNTHLQAQRSIDNIIIPPKEIPYRILECKDEILDFYMLGYGPWSCLNYYNKYLLIKMKKDNVYIGLTQKDAFIFSPPANIEPYEYHNYIKSNEYMKRMPYDELPYVEKAMYGDIYNEKTVCDESVRRGLTIHDFILFDWHSIIGNYKAKINSICNYDIDIIPHSINIYNPGCHFKEHVDTPRYPNMIGTIVMQLNPSIKGGNLIIENKEINLYNESVFFFTGKVHQVTPVEEGQRITITFDVLYKKKHNIEIKLSNWFDLNIGFEWKEKRCAIILHDVYSIDGMKEEIMKNPNDQTILGEIKQRGIPYIIGRIVISRELNEGYEEDYSEIDTTIMDSDMENSVDYITDKLDSESTSTVGAEIIYNALGYDLSGKEIIVDMMFMPKNNQVCNIKRKTQIKNSYYTGNQWTTGMTLVDKRVYHTTAIFI